MYGKSDSALVEHVLRQDIQNLKHPSPDHGLDLPGMLILLLHEQAYAPSRTPTQLVLLKMAEEVWRMKHDPRLPHALLQVLPHRRDLGEDLLDADFLLLRALRCTDVHLMSRCSRDEFIIEARDRIGAIKPYLRVLNKLVQL